MAKRWVAVRGDEAVTKPPLGKPPVFGRCHSREQALKEMAARGDLLLFRARHGGPIRESRVVQDHFKPLLESAELPAIRLYDLRHTAATISLIAGVSPKVISE